MNRERYATGTPWEPVVGYPLALEGESVVSFRPLNLAVVDGIFAVSRLAADAPIPRWATAGSFCSITRTADELTVVCGQDAVPEGITCERGWRSLRVAGAVPFSAVGVLASLTVPLAEAGVSVFAVSTFDTDFLLVKKEEAWERALEALVRSGHAVQKE